MRRVTQTFPPFLVSKRPLATPQPRERSQHHNRASAFAMLQSQLYARAQANQRAESDAARQKNPIGWRQQIRSLEATFATLTQKS